MLTYKIVQIFMSLCRKHLVQNSTSLRIMGKNDFLTPKAIANRIKAKGLQKLRWYCQMCQKQCRDEVRLTFRSKEYY